MEQLLLKPTTQTSGTVTLPGSKSISNRTLLLAALAQGTTQIREVLASDDTARMLEALKILGVPMRQVAPLDWDIDGVGGQFPNKQANLFLGNAGTAFRPLTAALAFNHGHYQLSGIPRMHERPIGDLVDGLRMAGAQISYLGNEGYPPLAIQPANNTNVADIAVKGNVSSQFLTAILMSLPLLKKQGTVRVIGELISKPYIEITLNLMQRFGVQVERSGWESFHVAENAEYISPGHIHVEGDASSASYFLAAGAIAAKHGKTVKIEGVGKHSIQGDIRFVDEIQKMGAIITTMTDHYIEVSAPHRLKAIDLDCNHIPDAAMTLAIMALFAEGTTTLRNIASWRVKETDRIHAMATELRKVGAIVAEGEDFIQITPPSELTPNAIIDTYDDHRMAMCFSLVSLGNVPIFINDPHCVAKTFPDYFERFASIVK